MQNYEIVKIDIDEYHKCNQIWNMKNNPYTDAFIKQVKNGDRQVYIYKIGDEFIAEGNLVINHNDSDYYIPGKRIYVSHMITKAEYRNQGIGGIMLDYLIEKAKSMGYTEMALGVDIDNYSAIHLYKKKGFDTVIQEAEDEYGKYVKLLKKID